MSLTFIANTATATWSANAIGTSMFPVGVTQNGYSIWTEDNNQGFQVCDIETTAVTATRTTTAIQTDFLTSYPSYGGIAGFNGIRCIPGTNTVVVLCNSLPPAGGASFLASLSAYTVNGDGSVTYLKTAAFYASIYIYPNHQSGLAVGSDGTLYMSSMSAYDERAFGLTAIPPVSTWVDGSFDLAVALNTNNLVGTNILGGNNDYASQDSANQQSAGFVLPVANTSINARAYYYISRQRVRWMTDNSQFGSSFISNSCASYPRGFIFSMDFGVDNAEPRIANGDFDMNGPPFSDEGFNLDGTDAGAWGTSSTAVCYSENFIPTKISDGTYALCFNQTYLGANSSTTGQANKAVMYLYDANTTLFTYQGSASGVTLDSVAMGQGEGYRFNFGAHGPVMYYDPTDSTIFMMEGTNITTGTTQTAECVTSPFATYVASSDDGSEEALRAFDLEPFTAVEITYARLTPTTIGETSNAANTASNTSVVVPDNMSTLLVNWLIAGGGGGGAGTEGGYGGGGGGGGEGGYWHGSTISVNPGDTVEFFIGNGAAQNMSVNAIGSNDANDGLDGQDSWITVNGTEVLRATGGKGGKHQTGVGGVVDPPAAGGAGGTPNGLAGVSGEVGDNDHSSSEGGAGAAGPMAGSAGGAGGDATGGNTFTGGSAGKLGTGYGSGGGGGGCRDRAGQNNWAGAGGNPGYAAWSFSPKQTQSGPSSGDPLYIVRLCDNGFVRFMTDPLISNATATFNRSDPLFGSIQGIGQISESVASSAPRLQITFNPPDRTGVNFIDDQSQQGANVRIWTGIVDQLTGLVVFQPKLIWTGFVDVTTTTYDMNSLMLQMDVGSVFELLFLASEGQRLNNQSHQRAFPGEDGLAWLIEATGPTYWGQQAPSPAYAQVAISPTIGDRVSGNNAGGLSSGQTINT